MKNGREILVAVIGSSAVNGSLSLSRSLVDRGFNVTYLAFGNEHRGFLEAQGFAVHPIDESNFKYDPTPVRGKFKGLKRRRLGITQNHLFIEYINGQIEQWLDTVKPELVLLDSNSLCHSIPFLKKKIPIININCTLSSLASSGNPPVFCGLLPPPNENRWVFPVKNKLVWGRLYLAQFFGEFRQGLTSRIAFGEKRFPSIRRQVERLGGKTRRTEYGLRLLAPEILLGSRYLDFPDLNRSKAKVYAGVCVDEERQQPDLDPGFINDKKTLIYCAMGTCSKLYVDARNLCECLFQVMRGLPDHQLVLQTDSIKEEGYKNLPENVRVYSRVPQLQMLRRARLFITHGGHCSIREGVFYGVPMIVFPGWHDQPGNAARVVYHGLGVRSNMKDITLPALASMIRNVLHNSEIHDSVKQMQRKIAEGREVESAIQFITGFIN